MSKYYTLFTWETELQQWTPQFGDYEKSVVKDEMIEYRNQGYKGKHLAIFDTPDEHGQAAIDHMATFLTLNHPMKD